MGSSDEPKEPDNQQPNTAGGKDLLYGWLVGRAAADLGLAQALAVTESRRNDQIKRLEENLLAQVRELQTSQSASSGSEQSAVEIEALKAEMERFAVRQQRLEGEQTSSDELEALVRLKLGEFEQQIQQQQAQSSNNDFGEFKFELTLLADRIARAEFTNQQAQALITAENQRLEAQVADLVRQETLSFKAQIIEQLRSEQSAAPALQNLEALLQKRVEDLRSEFIQGDQHDHALPKLQTELADLASRLNHLESTADQSINLTEERERSRKESEQQLNLRLAELNDAIHEKLNGFDAVRAERDSQAAALAVCFERLARLEDIARMGAADLKAEISALKTRLEESARKAADHELNLGRIEQSLGARIGEIQEQFSSAQKTSENRDGEIRALNGQVTTLSAKLSVLAERVEDQTDRQTERADWNKQIEQLVSSRAQQLEGLLDREREQREKSDLESSRLQVELSSALNRLAQLEVANEQVLASTVAQAQRWELSVDQMNGEFGSLKTEWSQHSEQQLQMSIQRLQDYIDGKFDAVQGFLDDEQQNTRNGQALLGELRAELQLMTQRLIQTESTAQQTHALMINETEQAGQLQNSLMSELAALRTQLGERQTHDARVDGAIEDLSARFDEMKNQLPQKWALGENRDGAIAELKNQFQNLAHQLAEKSTATPTVSRIYGPVGATAGPTSGKAPSDGTAILTPASETSETGPLMQSFGADPLRDRKKELQQRLSADIERVRAELRKRAGVSR